VNSFSNLNLVIAHKLEAELLIKHLALELIAEDKYKIYRNTGGTQLIVSGMGYGNARDATEYLAGMDSESEEPRAWLNVGIAGHQSAEIGSCLVANKIIHKVSGDCAFPAMIFPNLRSSEVMTVDEPELEYPRDIAYEMEAAGFWAAAVKHSSLEFLQCLKIISDNKNHSTDRVNSDLIRTIINDNLHTILHCCEQLQQLCGQFNESGRIDEAVAALIKRFHFTVTQEHQLERLWQRYSALGKADEFLRVTSQDHDSAKCIINELDKQIETE